MSEDGSGSGGQVTTDVVTMEVVASQLQDSRTELEGTIQALRARVAAVDEVWRSKAANQFAGIMERWDRNGRQLNLALDELAEGVRSSGRSYEEAVQEQSAALNRVDPGSGSSLSGTY
ncbi:WXG100 family type VII secretion target [Rhodococcus sp. HNM0563]|uniref:WXG100 family type VII secretion target n=1 Tax=unclassified Rhodococcus (in: high G+C Gram-positive bacteria) TaxID=192944 RepID=UPI00146BF4A9|nr:MULTISPECIES: WXG100 family type VII secretion target [unclassified Rhodococcus (in: high G+C Gram-positive bacteria)]MCK0093295.1 WXG100 family type VII secretion target [Rhodococcus sp. F64268]NLU60698.1 WXG100 family type VII secretion target [Rhodococcus sp. HNM0563]